MSDLNQKIKRDSRTGETYNAGRDLDQDRIDDAKRQDAAGLGSVKRKPVAQRDEEDESKMSPLQLASYRNKKRMLAAASSLAEKEKR